MPYFSIDGSKKVIESNPKRKMVSFSMKTSGKFIYITDLPPATLTNCKWIVVHGSPLIIDRNNGFPERAYYAGASGTSELIVGFQNDDEEPKP